jgi:hypothetical protein
MTLGTKLMTFQVKPSGGGLNLDLWSQITPTDVHLVGGDGVENGGRVELAFAEGAPTVRSTSPSPGRRLLGVVAARPL